MCLLFMFHVLHLFASLYIRSVSVSTRLSAFVRHSVESMVIGTLLGSYILTWHLKSRTSYHSSEVQVLHLVPNEIDSKIANIKMTETGELRWHGVTHYADECSKNITITSKNKKTSVWEMAAAMVRESKKLTQKISVAMRENPSRWSGKIFIAQEATQRSFSTEFKAVVAEFPP